MSRGIHASKGLRTSATFSARTYVTAVPPNPRTYPTKFVPKAPAAKASTTAANTNGNTAGDIAEDIDTVEMMDIPAESVPSASALAGVTPTFVSESGIGSMETGLETGSTDWSKSYHGLSQQPFPKEVADILLAPIDPMDIEMKPGE